jgi:sigma-E factor negative regulatory protein RseA
VYAVCAEYFVYLSFLISERFSQPSVDHLSRGYVMETPTRLQEHISAMVDNELPAAETELTLAALSEPEGLAAWRIYHLVGDALRAHQPEAELSSGFAARLAERLAAEELPVHPADAVRDGAVDPAPSASAAPAMP